MPIARLHRTDAILLEMERRLVLRRGRPVPTLRRFRHIDLPDMRRWYQHAESNPLAVRRPANVRWSLVGVGDLRCSAFGIHVPHEDLRAARLALGDISEACPVRRPHRTRAFAEHSVVRAIRVHEPERGVPAVLDLVHIATGVDDLFAVGRNLWITDLLVVEVMIDREQCVGAPLLGTASRRGAEYEEEGERKVSSHRLLRMLWAGGKYDPPP